jgi:hypothetical protein
MSCDTNNGVSSFNGRRGSVTLTEDDVTNAIGGTPLFAPVANASLATMATNTVKANLTSGTDHPQDVTLAALASALGSAFTISSISSGTSGSNTIYTITIGTLVVKFGTCSITALNGAGLTGAAVLVFPTAFPTALRAVVAMPLLSSGSVSQTSYSTWYAAASAAGVTIGISVEGGGTTGPFTTSWIAVGS